MSNREYLNETLKLLNERASLRSFSDKEVTEKTLNQLLEAGTHAASGGNLQPFSIIKIRDNKKKEKLVELGNQVFIKTAPVNLLFCIDYYRLRRIAEIEKAPFTATSSFAHFWIALEDTVIAAQTVCTAADSIGLGSVYIGTIFTEPETLKSCKQLFELPDEVLPVVLVTMGYPKVKPPIKKKFDIYTLVHDEKYRIPTDEELKEAVERKYDGQKFEVSEKDERIETIRKVCEKAHGKEFADKVVQEIKKNGYISTFQYRFGLHYRADMMPEVNEDLIELIKEYGFDVFS
ncbi:MAG: nitroreductase family protein [Kosmotogaceae bacterium]